MLNPLLWNSAASGNTTPARGLATAALEPRSSLGLVKSKTVQILQQGLDLDCGQVLGPITVEYQTYGNLSPAKDNVILVCHALSGGAHAAGIQSPVMKLGWWDNMIGPGKAFDTNRYFVICSNVLGSCYGTTGPGSINPDTGKPYGTSFPVVTIPDMVRVQRHLLEALGIEQLLAVAGGSMGAMQALQWAVSYPDLVRSVIAIAATHAHTPQQIAFNKVARQSIMGDPAWNGGHYYDAEPPRNGLAVARMLGHVTYLSDASMQRKFGRRLHGKTDVSYNFEIDFEVESYMRHQGYNFVDRFDANSLLYLTKALDYFDLSSGHESLPHALGKGTADYLLVSFTSDWLYPSSQMEEIATATRIAGLGAEHHVIDSDHGHDAFLLEAERQHPLVRRFLKKVTATTRQILTPV